MRGAGRRLSVGLVGLLVLAALAGCDLERGTATRHDADLEGPATGGTGFDPTAEDEQALRELMAARAAAVEAHDLRAFRATVDPRQPKLVKQQTTLFRNLTKLSLVSLGYDVSTTYLVPADVPGRDPVVHPQVVEQLQLVGTMKRPVSNKLDLTFVRRQGRWLVGAERPPGAQGSVEEAQERPWFGVPIAVHHDGKLTVVVDAASADQLDGLVDAVRDGVRRDADILGVEADDQVLVDATSNGESTKVGGASKAEAAAVTIPLFASQGAAGGSIAGVAIKVNPKHVPTVIDDSRVLWHELTHYLLFAHAGSSPVWLTEGVASWVEWQPSEMDQLVVPDELYEKLQRPPHQLPTKGVFYGKADVSYPVAQAAVQWLVDRAGTAKLLELMKTYARMYQGVDTDAVTPQAIRKVYGISERELVDGTWATLSSLHH